MSNIEKRPGFCGLGKIKGPYRSNAFTKMRFRANDVSLVLERAEYGYILSGLDLPASGVHCNNLNEVSEELENYDG